MTFFFLVNKNCSLVLHFSVWNTQTFQKTFLRFLFWVSPRGFTITWVINSLGGKLIFSSETETSLQEGCSRIQPWRCWELRSVSYRNIRRNSLSQLYEAISSLCYALVHIVETGLVFLKLRTKGNISRMQLKKFKVPSF